jgi:diguanylate cyclase (GGDEF)-like protein/PAS domain S-box-containing protein
MKVAKDIHHDGPGAGRLELPVLMGQSSGLEKHSVSDFLASSQDYLLRTMIDFVPDYLFVKDLEGRFVVANPAVAEDLGHTVDNLIGKTDFDLHARELAEEFSACEQAVIRSGEPKIDIEEFVITATGRKKWLATSKLPLRDPEGEIVGVVGVSRDISERKRVEIALAEANSRWNFALEGAGQGVWDHNLKTGTAYFSPVWRRMRGIGLDDPIDSSREAWLERVHPDDRERLIEKTDQQNSGQLSGNAFEYRERHRDGHYIWIMSRGKPVEFDADGGVARIIGTDTDISSLKRAEAQIAEEKEQTYRRHLAALEKAQEATEAAHRLSEALARHDALTGLPNRRVFAEMLDKAVSRARGGPVGSCVLIVDLDRFKPINDANGHAAGDDVLREISKRLSDLTRAGDTVARLGGDEFGLILDGIAPELMAETASTLASRISTELARPISVGSQTVQVGASIGISICPDDGTTSDALLRAADMAMYRVKEEGRGDHLFYERQLENVIRERDALEQDVRQAVMGQDIFPFYQPLIHLTDKRLVGFEILARWNHPERGEMEPDVFIPVVENLNLIGEMSCSLLRRACLDACDWPADITIAFNVSAMHLSDPLLPVQIQDILTETGFPPERLEIEVSETSLVANIDAARTALVALQAMGMNISLDDFGTGFSSLTNLRELRFKKIKIDQSFISAMLQNPDDSKIVSAVIALADTLGLPVVAEGIERQQELHEIISRGGEYGQGFYFSQAVPAAEAAIMADTGNVSPK